MRVQIIPLRRMPSNLRYLDYLPGYFENELLVGQLVIIPFRNKKEFGIVKTISDTSEIEEHKLKNIHSIVTKEPLIPAYLIEFCIEISEFYRAPIGFVLKSALLPLKKNKIAKIENRLIVCDDNKIFEPQKPILVSYQDIESRNKIITKIAQERGQTLVLVPEISNITTMFELLNSALSKKPLTVSGEMGEKDMFDLWLNVRSDENSVAIGTRKAIFLPWINLKNIIIDDEGNPDYKSWDMAPRFHTRDAALMLAKYSGAKLYLMSTAPSVDSYYFAKQGVYDAAGQVEKHSTPSPIFIDAVQERTSTQASHIASDVIESLQSTTGDAFIFVNRRGTSSAVLCRDCGYLFNCSICRRPMTYFESGKKLTCLFCGESKPLSINCPTCSGPSYRMMSPGAEGIAQELKKILPKKRIVAIEKNDPATLKEIKFPGSKIIVGTKYAWYNLLWPRLEVMVFADPDSTLAIPEYRATEFLWQNLRQSQLKLPEQSQLYIQTSHPEHHVFQGLYNPAIFYETELTERQVFSYPPHQYLVRLIYAGSKVSADRESNRLFKSLQTLTQTLGDVKINGPFLASPETMRGKIHRIIIIKLNYKNYKQRLKMIANTIPDDWKIDPNPNNLLSIA